MDANIRTVRFDDWGQQPQVLGCQFLDRCRGLQGSRWLAKANDAWCDVKPSQR